MSVIRVLLHSITGFPTLPRLSLVRVSKWLPFLTACYPMLHFVFMWTKIYDNVLLNSTKHCAHLKHVLSIKICQIYGVIVYFRVRSFTSCDTNSYSFISLESASWVPYWYSRRMECKVCGKISPLMRWF